MSHLNPSRRFRVKRLWKLPLWCFIALVAVCSAPVTRGGSEQQDQKISPEAARQIGELAREKRARTAAQKKIDTQLLYALKQKRGETVGVPVEPVDIKLDADGCTLVEISAKVSTRLVSKLSKAGAEVISKSAKYHTVRVRVALEKIEALAEIEEVRYISPVGKAMTHGGARKN